MWILFHKIWRNIYLAMTDECLRKHNVLHINAKIFD